MTENASENLILKPTVKNITKDPKSKNVSKNILKDLRAKARRQTPVGIASNRRDVKICMQKPESHERVHKYLKRSNQRPEVKKRHAKSLQLYYQKLKDRARLDASFSPKTKAGWKK